MKKQLILCLAFLGLSISACEESVMPLDPPAKVDVLSIEYIYPEFAVPGSEITIGGENFGNGIMDNYVTINGQYSEVTYVESGRKIMAMVPNELSSGEHNLSVFANGQVSSRTCFIVEETIGDIPD